MSAEVIPFPEWKRTGRIVSEAEMISWAVQKMAVERNSYTRKEAREFGRLLWAEFQKRAQET